MIRFYELDSCTEVELKEIKQAIADIQDQGYNLDGLDIRIKYDGTHSQFVGDAIEIDINACRFPPLDFRFLIGKGLLKNTIYHEIGHHIFYTRNPEYWDTLSHYCGMNNQAWQWAIGSIDIEGEISYYATTMYEEFVAEVFSGLMQGLSFSKDIMSLYYESMPKHINKGE